MLSFLFAICFWYGAFALAALMVVLSMCVVFCVSDWLRARRQRRAWAALAARVASLTATAEAYRTALARPFDWDDPLEHQFALPSAPDPRRRVR